MNLNLGVVYPGVTKFFEKHENGARLKWPLNLYSVNLEELGYEPILTSFRVFFTNKTGSQEALQIEFQSVVLLITSDGVVRMNTGQEGFLDPNWLLGVGKTLKRLPKQLEELCIWFENTRINREFARQKLARSVCDNRLSNAALYEEFLTIPLCHFHPTQVKMIELLIGKHVVSRVPLPLERIVITLEKSHATNLEETAEFSTLLREIKAALQESWENSSTGILEGSEQMNAHFEQSAENQNNLAFMEIYNEKLRTLGVQELMRSLADKGIYAVLET